MKGSTMKRNSNRRTLIIRGILFTVLISIHVLNVQGQNPGKAEAQVKASVTIISGLEINQKKNMHFGEIKVPKKEMATIELNPDGSTSYDIARAGETLEVNLNRLPIIFRQHLKLR